MNSIDREPGGPELVARYRRHYSIPDDSVVTEEMVLRHWRLEMALTERLLGARPNNRGAVFEECYSRLYGELPWLNTLLEKADNTPPSAKYAAWRMLLGHPPKRIYEIGSGTGHMIRYLAEEGFECRGTDIASGRGAPMSPHLHPNMSWGRTDGVHLAQFEPLGSYDAVLSDQVIEHLHPDDLLDHLRGVLDVLRTGGMYILRTPHRFTGPHDISRVFNRRTAEGMHLREYTFGELVHGLEIVGFTRIHSVMPLRVQRMHHAIVTRTGRGSAGTSMPDRAVVRFFERCLSLLPANHIRFCVARFLAGTRVFRSNIFLAAVK